MGRLFLVDLEGRRYSCIHCDVALALYSDVISKESYSWRNNKAYFFANVVNVTTGEPKEWSSAGGQFMLSDIFCVGCGSLLGFKHVTAFATEKYKEGKFVLERNKVYGHYILTNNGQLLGSDDDENGEEESNDEEAYSYPI